MLSLLSFRVVSRQIFQNRLTTALSDCLTLSSMSLTSSLKIVSSQSPGRLHKSAQVFFQEEVLFSSQYHFFDWNNKNTFCPCCFKLINSIPEFIFLYNRMKTEPSFFDKRKNSRALHPGKYFADFGQSCLFGALSNIYLFSFAFLTALILKSRLSSIFCLFVD